MGNIFEDFGNWLIDDVFDIDVPKATSPYAAGRDVPAHSTENYLPVHYGAVLGAPPQSVPFMSVSNPDDNDDTENDLLHKIFIFGKSVSEISEVRVDEVVADYQGNFEGWLYCNTFINGMNNYGDRFLNNSGFKQGDYNYTDCAIAYIRAEWGSSLVTSEPTNITADLKGEKATRNLSDTFTSDQRYDNGVLHFYDYLTTSNSGPGWPSELLHTESWIAAAQKCLVQIETHDGSGVYRNQLTFNGTLDTSQNINDIITLFRQAINAHMPFIDGQYHLYIEADDNYADIEIYDDDIVDGITTNESADVGDKINQIVVKFPDKEQNGVLTEAIYPAVGSDLDLEYLTEDNQQRKSKNVELNFCNNESEALQIAKQKLEISREGLKAKFKVKPRCRGLRCAQIVYVSNIRRGWERKPFRIIGKTLHRDLYSDLKLREHQPYIYATHDIPSRVYPDTTSRTFKISSPTNLSVLASNFGGKKVSWSSTYSKFDWQLEKADGTIINGQKSVTGTSIELQNLIDGTEYVIAIRARNNIGQISSWEEINFTYTVSVTSDVDSNNSIASIIQVPAVNSNLSSDDYVWKIYYSKTDFGASPVIASSIFAGVFPYLSGQTFQIVEPDANTKYFIWFGVIKKAQSTEVPQSWDKKQIETGSGITSNNAGSVINLMHGIYGRVSIFENFLPSSSDANFTVVEDVDTTFGIRNVWNIESRILDTDNIPVVYHAEERGDFNLDLSSYITTDQLIFSVYIRHTAIESAAFQITLSDSKESVSETLSTSATIGEFTRVSTVLNIPVGLSLCNARMYFYEAGSGSFQYFMPMLEQKLTDSDEPSDYSLAQGGNFSIVTASSLGVYTSAESDNRYGLLNATNEWYDVNDFKDGLKIGGTLIELLFSDIYHDHDGDYLGINAKAQDAYTADYADNAGLFDGFSPNDFYSSRNKPTLSELGVLDDDQDWSGAHNFTGGILENNEALSAKYLGINSKAQDAYAADFADNANLLDGYNSTHFYSLNNKPTLSELGVLDDAHTWSSYQIFTNDITVYDAINLFSNSYSNSRATLFRDANNRIATDADFYVRSGSANTYLYSTNTYLGNSSGDSIYVRGNRMSGNNWSLEPDGEVRGTLFKENGVDINDKFLSYDALGYNSWATYQLAAKSAIEFREWMESESASNSGYDTITESVATSFVNTFILQANSVAAQGGNFNYLTSNVIDVVDLFAQEIVSDGTITGVTFKSAQAGQRVEIDANSLDFFNNLNERTSIAAASNEVNGSGGVSISNFDADLAYIVLQNKTSTQLRFQTLDNSLNIYGVGNRDNSSGGYSRAYGTIVNVNYQSGTVSLSTPTIDATSGKTQLILKNDGTSQFDDTLDILAIKQNGVWLDDIYLTKNGKAQDAYDSDYAANAGLFDGIDSTGFMRQQSANGYYGLFPAGSNSNWVRTTKNGLIPYQAGGYSSLGTSSWPFANVHAENIYQDGTLLSDIYAQKVDDAWTIISPANSTTDLVSTGDPFSADANTFFQMSGSEDVAWTSNAWYLDPTNPVMSLRYRYMNTNTIKIVGAFVSTSEHWNPYIFIFPLSIASQINHQQVIKVNVLRRTSNRTSSTNSYLYSSSLAVLETNGLLSFENGSETLGDFSGQYWIESEIYLNT